jgi:hypothetical protein
MKGTNGRARAHIVPVTDEVMAVLDGLPRFNSGQHLFSTTYGASPVWIGSKIKQRLDKRMLRTLRALARLRGDDAARIILPRFVNHDIRRSIRTNLSRLKIAEEVSEALLAHTPGGIRGVYNKYGFLDEKKEALQKWAKQLRAITEPPPPNVVQLPARA